MRREFSILGFLMMSVLISLSYSLFHTTSHMTKVASALDCPHFTPGESIGSIQTTLLNETSGIAASWKNLDVLWAHNDSGDSARVFALTTTGKLLGIYNLAGASAVDWEDMAIGPGPISGQDYLYLGDTGDNLRTRSSIAVYRALEPVVSDEQAPVTIDLTDWALLPMQYPDSVAFDAETLLVDPVSGDLFVVTRDRSGEGVTRVFRNPAPHTSGVMVTLELVAELSLTMQVKGGDASPSGDAVLLRPHSSGVPANGLYWRREPGTDLWDAFSESPCLTPLADEPQGEALAFAADGNGYLTISEGSTPPIYFYLLLPNLCYLPLIFYQSP